MGWKDLFSSGAASYARYRPRYPEALFTWLASVAPGRSLAVDVGAGNAQASRSLVPHFDRVIAVEPSAEQLSQAGDPGPGLELRQGPAEALPVDAGSADLILAAQAFHWFRADQFFAEAARVLRPGGVLALCCYQLSIITPEVDEVVARYYAAVDRHWEPERRLVEDGYRSVPAPFPEITVPPFEMALQWTLGDLVGYLGTWSARTRFIKVEGRDPLQDYVPQLEAAWRPDLAEVPRPVRWPMPTRAFRLPASPGAGH